MVVSDATPLRYLVQINEVDLLRRLYGMVGVPAAVQQELLTNKTPDLVRVWIATPPAWIKVLADMESPALPHPELGIGERQAMAAALADGENIVLTDDAEARVAAQGLGIQTVPTIRILSTAAALHIVDFDDALERLLRTNFRISNDVVGKIRSERNTQ